MKNLERAGSRGSRPLVAAGRRAGPPSAPRPCAPAAGRAPLASPHPRREGRAPPASPHPHRALRRGRDPAAASGQDGVGRRCCPGRGWGVGARWGGRRQRWAPEVTERPGSFIRGYLLPGPAPVPSLALPRPLVELLWVCRLKASPIKLIDLAYEAPQKRPEGDYVPGLG